MCCKADSYCPHVWLGISRLFWFSGYGNVVDVKINRKGVTRDLPVCISCILSYYSFVTYGTYWAHDRSFTDLTPSHSIVT